MFLKRRKLDKNANRASQLFLNNKVLFAGNLAGINNKH